MKTLKIIFLLFCSSHIFAQIPSYYNGIDFTNTSSLLFNDLATITINNHQGIPYTSGSTDTWDVLKTADKDPDISSNILLIYGYNDSDTENNNDRTRGNDQGFSGDPFNWNREHVFAKSLANPSLETGSIGPGTDLHNLRPADAGYNSSRSNRKFTDGSGNSGPQSNGGWYPGDEWKGDIARMVMYMYLRYHGTGEKISETNCLPINVGSGSILDIDSNMIGLFLEWNQEDPVSNFEINRNNVILDHQKNRNPFIDNPYLATLIWGGIAAEDKWNLISGTSDVTAPTTPSNIKVMNITSSSADISWTTSTDNVGVFEYLIYINNTYIKSAINTSTVLENLSSSTNYTVFVKARDAANNQSTNSSTQTFTTQVGNTYLIKEKFEFCDNSSFNFYSEASENDWECNTVYGFDNTGSVSINGYNQDTESKDWMITKNTIDFNTNKDIKLNFYTDAKYGSSTLEIVYSSNYTGTGDPTNATWKTLPNITIPTGTKSSSSEEIFTFNNIDLSSLTGNLYIAFKYYTEGNAPTRWTVDNFEVFTSPSLNTKNITEEYLKTYPNPVKNTLTIDSTSKLEKVTVYSITGKKLSTAIINNNQIDTTNLEKGIYIFNFTTNNGYSFTSRVIKK